jgi:hypothetical protein
MTDATVMSSNLENQDPEKLEKEIKVSIEKVRKIVREEEGVTLEDSEPPLFRSKDSNCEAPPFSPSA